MHRQTCFARVLWWDHMSKTSIGDFGLGLLWLPGGFLFILVVVMGLFLLAHDTPPSHNLGSANYHATES